MRVCVMYLRTLYSLLIKMQRPFLSLFAASLSTLTSYAHTHTPSPTFLYFFPYTFYATTKKCLPWLIANCVIVYIPNAPCTLAIKHSLYIIISPYSPQNCNILLFAIGASLRTHPPFPCTVTSVDPLYKSSFVLLLSE